MLTNCDVEQVVELQANPDVEDTPKKFYECKAKRAELLPAAKYFATLLEGSFPEAQQSFVDLKEVDSNEYRYLTLTVNFMLTSL